MTHHSTRVGRAAIPALLSLTLLGGFLGTSQAAAQQAASAQVGYGPGFADDNWGLHTSNRRLQTTTLAYDGAWRYGENSTTLRLFSGPFVDAVGAPTHAGTLLYAEWTTRLDLLKIGGPAGASSGAVRGVFLAAQLNRGSGGIHNDLVGVGMRLGLSATATVTSSVYARHADGGWRGLKWRTSWSVPFRLGPAAFSLEGSEDVLSATGTGWDFSGQPALLVDAGALVGLGAQHLQAGIEHFHHDTHGTHLQAPQAVVRWTF